LIERSGVRVLLRRLGRRRRHRCFDRRVAFLFRHRRGVTGRRAADEQTEEGEEDPAIHDQSPYDPRRNDPTAQNPAHESKGAHLARFGARCAPPPLPFSRLLSSSAPPPARHPATSPRRTKATSPPEPRARSSAPSSSTMPIPSKTIRGTT